jgi:hypothetical protein
VSAAGPRHAARLAGATRYFTGKPCAQGHVADRHVINGSCTACLAVRKVRDHTAIRIAENKLRIRKARAAGIVPKRTGEASVAHRKAREAHQKRLPHVVAARQARQRERLATDPIYQLNQRVRCRVHHALKHVGLTKNRKSWVDLVGYSAADLKRHLERQFTKGMSWDNAGEWHIEHITALVRFSYTSVDDPEFRAAWALSNLRPLWGPENKSKGSKRTHLL